LTGDSRIAGFCKVLIVILALVMQFSGCRQIAEPPETDRQGVPGEIGAKGAPERYDLARDEELGGHTLERHVGRSDAELEERLRWERNISAASTWTDRQTAEITIAQALRAEHGQMENWMRRGMPRANLALHYDAGHVSGRSLRRGDNRPVDCTRAVIVLRATGPSSFYVLTAYPEASE
jgi:Bacterial CdiA-CT RNAse A domain